MTPGYRAKTFLWRCLAVFFMGFGPMLVAATVVWVPMARHWDRAMTAFANGDHDAGSVFLLSCGMLGMGMLALVAFGAAFVWFGMTATDAAINCEKPKTAGAR